MKDKRQKTKDKKSKTKHQRQKKKITKFHKLHNQPINYSTNQQKQTTKPASPSTPNIY